MPSVSPLAVSNARAASDAVLAAASVFSFIVVPPDFRRERAGNAQIVAPRGPADRPAVL
ncbi:hypothetical protein WME94_09885 [Sorangium sp. So ce429]